MGSFWVYFSLGKDHILDYANGYDHILFIVALCALYLPRDWKAILTLVTAFTLGHSVTLALVTLSIISVSPAKVEFFIPVTIFVTAMVQLFNKNGGRGKGLFQTIQLSYLLALFFGLIHGMGFAGYLREALGLRESIVVPLLAFNLGLELGQLIVVALFMVVAFLAIEVLKASRDHWRMTISAMIAGAALVLMRQNVFW